MLGVPLDAYPAVSSWLERLVERPAVAMEVEVVATL
jgi:glutathione S-transferase